MNNKILIILALFCGLHSSGQTLSDYLLIAEKNSPDLKASTYSYESALEKIVEVGSLPNSTIGVGYFIQEAETRVGGQKAKISLGQKLPWFGTITARKESASFKAKALQNSIDLTKRSLFLEVKTRYFRLYELQSKAQILSESIDILNTFEELALNELEVNRSTMVDVLKIRMEKNELSSNLLVLQENLKSEKFVFNLLLNREKQLPILIPDHLGIDPELSAVKRDQISNNPQLLKLDNMKKALEASEVISKKEGAPTFGLGLDYVLVEDRPVQNLSENGKDIIMPMVSLSFPLFSNKYRSQQKQLHLEQKAIASNKLELENELISVFEKAESAMKNAAISSKTQVKNIEDANSAKEVLLAAYQTSIIDFEQLLEIQLLKLKFQFKKVASEKQYHIEKATLEFISQEPLVQTNI